MIDKENLHEWISRYTDGELDKSELAEFQLILDSDPGVRSEVALDRELTDFLHDKDLLEFLELLERTLRNRRPGFGLNCLLLAALLTFLLAFSGFWIYIQPICGKWPVPAEGEKVCPGGNGSGKSGQILPMIRRSPGFFPPALTLKNMEPELLAANFRPLMYLEGWVGITTRSAPFILLTPDPVISVHPGDSIMFTWRGCEHDTLSFTLFDNRGEQLLKRNGVAERHLVLLTVSLPDGLYYWKFTDHTNLLQVGKILVRK